MTAAAAVVLPHCSSTAGPAAECAAGHPGATDRMITLPGAGEAGVWAIQLSAPPIPASALLPLLSVTERERAARFRVADDRMRAVVGRGMLRVILGACTARPPEAVELSTDAFDRPIMQQSTEIDFNVSHSGDWILIGVAANTRIGVDVEQIRPVADVSDLVQRFFAPAEAAIISSLHGEQQDVAFFDCWTRKEAYVKAVGAGLSLDLASFQVECRPGTEPAVLTIGGSAQEAARWLLWSAAPAAGYRAAVATEAASVLSWHWRNGADPAPWTG